MDPRGPAPDPLDNSGECSLCFGIALLRFSDSTRRLAMGLWAGDSQPTGITTRPFVSGAAEVVQVGSSRSRVAAHPQERPPLAPRHWRQKEQGREHRSRLRYRNEFTTSSNRYKRSTRTNRGESRVRVELHTAGKGSGVGEEQSCPSRRQN